MTERIAEVVEALGRRGFKYVERLEDGELRFLGTLTPEGQAHECEVLVDSLFIELPCVRLLKFPPSLPSAVEHLSSDGALCYLTKGTVVVDVFDPVGQTLAFIERAEHVLNQVLKRELVADLEEEFFAYWGGLDCFFDVQGSALGLLHTLLVGEPVPTALAITDSPGRTTNKLQTIGLAPSGAHVPAYRIRTGARPLPSRGAWPPESLGEILQWQQRMDPNCRKKIEQRVAEALRARHKGVVILIQSPQLVYGFCVLFEEVQQLPGKQNRPVNPRPYKVLPLSIYRMDAPYVSERNTPGQATLAKRRVVMVGCGTIGGYLADLLVKAGAGTGGGTLTLVDDDLFMPQNVGRHRLGFPHLLKNKASALANELCQQMPGTEIRALPIDVRHAHLGTVDLLIDATGEETITHWLAGQYSSKAAMLSVWIEGPGTAVRTLLRTEKSGACPRCMFRHSREKRYESVKGGAPQIYAGHGCEGLYVPFPATVSLQAAALGAEAALAWVNGAFEPTLRTRLTDSRYELATPDCSPTSFEDCPACGS